MLLLCWFECRVVVPMFPVTLRVSALSKQAVCCEDKIHCCPEGSTCDEHSKCVSQSAKTEMPMRTKLPAKRRAEQEGQKGQIVYFGFTVKPNNFLILIV